MTRILILLMGIFFCSPVLADEVGEVTTYVTDADVAVDNTVSFGNLEQTIRIDKSMYKKPVLTEEERDWVVVFTPKKAS